MRRAQDSVSPRDPEMRDKNPTREGFGGSGKASWMRGFPLGGHMWLSPICGPRVADLEKPAQSLQWQEGCKASLESRR